jgi:hypothetical protein
MADVGRPLKFKTPEELEEKINQYFIECESRGEKPFITELAYYLDTSRETLREYKERPEYVDSIKKALTRCEMALEKNLIEGKINPTGSIFNLKNNYGWKDRNETDITTLGEKMQSGVIILPQRNESTLETSSETDSSTRQE